MVCLYHAAQVNRRIKPVAHQQTQFMKDSVKQKVQKKARSEVKVNLPALKLSTTSAWLPLKALLLHIKHVNWAVFQPLCLVRSRLKMFFFGVVSVGYFEEIFQEECSITLNEMCFILDIIQMNWKSQRWSSQSKKGEMQDLSCSAVKEASSK